MVSRSRQTSPDGQIEGKKDETGRIFSEFLADGPKQKLLDAEEEEEEEAEEEVRVGKYTNADVRV